MSRPKGSKNKKSLLALSSVDAKIEAAQADKEKLMAEQAALMEEIATKKQLLKNNKKDLRKVEKILSNLEVKKQEADAVKAAEAKKSEIEQVVDSLLSSGQSLDDILAKIKS